MGMFESLFVKLIGKRLDADLTKWGISKTKVIAIVGALVAAYNQLAPTFGYPAITPDVFKILAALGLWALRDGLDTPDGVPTLPK